VKLDAEMLKKLAGSRKDSEARRAKDRRAEACDRNGLGGVWEHRSFGLKSITPLFHHSSTPVVTVRFFEQPALFQMDKRSDPVLRFGGVSLTRKIFG